MRSFFFNESTKEPLNFGTAKYSLFPCFSYYSYIKSVRKDGVVVRYIGPHSGPKRPVNYRNISKIYREIHFLDRSKA